eukprot:3424555-Rhodomonas_salina.7
MFIMLHASSQHRQHLAGPGLDGASGACFELEQPRADARRVCASGFPVAEAGGGARGFGSGASRSPTAPATTDISDDDNDDDGDNDDDDDDDGNVLIRFTNCNSVSGGRTASLMARSRNITIAMAVMPVVSSASTT